MKHSLTHTVKEDIIKDITSILKRHDEIVVGYVFGSFISSAAFSDIDIGVLLDQNLNTYLSYEFDLEIEVEDVVNYPTDVRVLNNAPLSFCQNVIRHGRIVLEKDANLKADFMGQTLKKYFDFAPFRRKYLEEVANAPI